MKKTLFLLLIPLLFIGLIEPFGNFTIKGGGVDTNCDADNECPLIHYDSEVTSHTNLTEADVDAYVANNGYLTSFPTIHDQDLNKTDAVNFYNLTTTDDLKVGDELYVVDKIGIQTSSSLYLLDIDTTTSSGIIARLKSQGDTGIAIVSSATSSVNLGDPTDMDEGRINYANGDDEMSFWTLDTKRMTIDDAGMVGIGTNSPSSVLEVKSSGTSTNVIEVQSSTDTQNLLTVYEDGDSDGILTVRNSSGNTAVQLATNGDSYFIGGDVGIGSSSPANKLLVKSGGTDTTVVKIEANDGSNLVSIGEGAEGEGVLDVRNELGVIKIHLNGTGDSYFDNNLGIGSEKPPVELVINSSIPRLRFYDNNDQGNYTQLRYNTGIFGIRNSIAGSGSNDVFQIEDLAPDDAFYINSDGNVGIGTNEPYVKLRVEGAVSREGHYYAHQTTAPTTLAAATYTTLDLDSVEFMDSDIYSESAGTVTLQQTGLYRITIRGESTLASGTREFAEVALYVNGAKIDDMYCTMYARETSGKSGTGCSASALKYLASSSTITVRFNPDTTGIDPKDNGSSLLMEYVGKV